MPGETRGKTSPASIRRSWTPPRDRSHEVHGRSLERKAHRGEHLTYLKKGGRSRVVERRFERSPWSHPTRASCGGNEMGGRGGCGCGGSGGPMWASRGYLRTSAPEDLKDYAEDLRAETQRVERILKERTAEKD